MDSETSMSERWVISLPRLTREKETGSLIIMFGLGVENIRLTGPITWCTFQLCHPSPGGYESLKVAK